MAFLKPDKTYNANGITVNEYLLTTHNPNNIAMPADQLPKKPLGITIHNTDWITIASGTTPAEQYTRATVNGNMNDVRVHFYVDNVSAWQNLPLTLCGWHAADGKGNGNMATIAIECIMSSNGGAASEKSEDNCAKLAAYLLNLYGLTVEDNLFTHTHWLNVKDGYVGDIDYLNTARNPYKWCPLYILPHWQTFKAKVKTYLSQLSGKKDTSSTATTTTTQSNLYRVRKSWTDAKSQIGAFGSLDNAKKACKEGYTVFDGSGKAVYTASSKSTATSTSTQPATGEQGIFTYLKSKGFNDFACAGIMGNLYAESALSSTNLENTYNSSLGMTDEQYTKAVDSGQHDFVNDSAGYGLAQWTYYTRKQNLLNLAKQQNKSIGDMNMQLDYLVEELKSDFNSVYNKLLKATSVKEASDIFMTGFENPANQSDSMKSLRASYGQKYYDKYKGISEQKTETNKPVNTQKEKIDIAYCVRLNSWLPPVTNCNDENEDGYAGIEGSGARAFAAKVSKGTLSYRVHIVGGGWLSWISAYDLNDFYNGYAGIISYNIDAIQAKLENVSGYNVEYRVSSVGHNEYYDWVQGTNDYAGVFGESVDKVQMRIIEV